MACLAPTCEAKWCTTDADNVLNCSFIDNGAYPIGDERVFADQVANVQALTPFPNAIYWNWVTFIVMAFGNLAALDFQVRCMAAKTPNTARLGCILGGCFTFFVGIALSFLGGNTRYVSGVEARMRGLQYVLRQKACSHFPVVHVSRGFYYGPDSPRAEFEADTCSEILGLPTCGMWVPDDSAFVKLLTHEAAAFAGACCMVVLVLLAVVESLFQNNQSLSGSRFNFRSLA